MSQAKDEMVTVFESSTYSAEVEVEMIKGLLESNGVEAVINGMDVLPGAHEVTIQVQADLKDFAERLIAEAIANGPAAAEKAEKESEFR